MSAHAHAPGRDAAQRRGPRPVDYSAYDEVVVRRIIDEQRVGAPISVADAAEAVRRLAVDHSDGQIAYKLSFCRRSVLRIRERHNIPPALRRGSTIADLRVSGPSVNDRQYERRRKSAR